MKPFVRIENLVKYFPIRAGVFKRIVAWVKAVDDVSFDIYEGETLGLVGESGCGKTTVGMTLLRLYEPTSGRIIVEDDDTTYYFLPGSYWKVLDKIFNSNERFHTRSPTSALFASSTFSQK